MKITAKYKTISFHCEEEFTLSETTVNWLYYYQPSLTAKVPQQLCTFISSDCRMEFSMKLDKSCSRVSALGSTGYLSKLYLASPGELGLAQAAT